MIKTNYCNNCAKEFECKSLSKKYCCSRCRNAKLAENKRLKLNADKPQNTVPKYSAPIKRQEKGERLTENQMNVIAKINEWFEKHRHIPALVQIHSRYNRLSYANQYNSALHIARSITANKGFEFVFIIDAVREIVDDAVKGISAKFEIENNFRRDMSLMRGAGMQSGLKSAIYG